MRVAISSGHALHVQGAVGILNELNENRRVTPIIANHLRAGGVEVATFDDNTSRTVAQNLDTINGWHNARTRDLDVQVEEFDDLLALLPEALRPELDPCELVVVTSPITKKTKK